MKMRQVPKWSEYFMDVAMKVASRSKDPNTQVGAVITNKHHDILATGYNGFPPGCKDDDELWERPIKYDRVIHAELNAIARAARRGHALEGGILYTTAFPCLSCAKAIIAAGITDVYYDSLLKGWDEEHQKAQELMAEAGIFFMDMGRIKEKI
jgi:dCMP deaminase